ncbi:hypothetical protein ACOJQI_09575 [Bacillus salacetis]|uniref:hypothetical protein n=1 Tax=Bacillus salacetis TaxID=2315464 RepID=UPI003BA0B8EB
MNNLKLFITIGAGIFGGLILMTFIQLEKADYRMEALGFIAITAAVYFILLWIFHKGLKRAFTAVVLVLAIVAISAAVFYHALFPATH